MVKALVVAESVEYTHVMKKLSINSGEWAGVSGASARGL
jgi:hypothetical protein